MINHQHSSTNLGFEHCAYHRWFSLCSCYGLLSDAVLCVSRIEESSWSQRSRSMPDHTMRLSYMAHPSSGSEFCCSWNWCILFAAVVVVIQYGGVLKMVDAKSFVLDDLGVSHFKFFCWPMALQKHPTCPYLSPSNHVRMILGSFHFEKHPAELGFVQISATCRHQLVPGITYASPCVWTSKHLHPLSACCQVFGNASSQLKFITTYKHPKDEQKHWTALGPFPAARVESHGVCCFRSSHDLRRCCRCQVGCHIVGTEG